MAELTRYPRQMLRLVSEWSDPPERTGMKLLRPPYDLPLCEAAVPDKGAREATYLTLLSRVVPESTVNSLAHKREVAGFLFSLTCHWSIGIGASVTDSSRHVHGSCG